jgi:hypothetical protein
MARSINRVVSSCSAITVVDVVASVRMLGATEELWKQMDEENSETRHTGTDEARIDFDC